MTTPFERYLASIAASFPSLNEAPLRPWNSEDFRTWAQAQPKKTAAW